MLKFILLNLIGLAEYIAILDVADFFIPKGRNKNFLDALNSINHKDVSLYDKIISKKRETIGPDEDKHPFCYINVISELVFNVKNHDPQLQGGVDPEHPWMGDRFAHGCEPLDNMQRNNLDQMKAIYPTESVFQGSNSGPGACKLPLKWTSCSRNKEIAMKIGSDSYCGNGTLSPARSLTISNIHDFDYKVIDKDSYFLDVHDQGSVYNFLESDMYLGLYASKKPSISKSLYTQNHFPSVLQDLRRRGLELMIILKDNVPHKPHPDLHWGNLFDPVSRRNNNNHDHIIKKALDKFPQLNVDNIDSIRHKMDHLVLPNFAIDYSEYALGAIIERVSDSFDLYVSTFLLCHLFLGPSKINGEIFIMFF
jgi:hypothetical protein